MLAAQQVEGAHVLGRLCNQHRLVCEAEGPLHPAAVELAWLCRDAVDASKHGAGSLVPSREAVELVRKLESEARESGSQGEGPGGGAGGVMGMVRGVVDGGLKIAKEIGGVPDEPFEQLLPPSPPDAEGAGKSHSQLSAVGAALVAEHADAMARAKAAEEGSGLGTAGGRGGRRSLAFRPVYDALRVHLQKKFSAAAEGLVGGEHALARHVYQAAVDRALTLGRPCDAAWGICRETLLELLRRANVHRGARPPWGSATPV